MSDLSRFALVTGAGSGIGRATARALCDAGWQVVLVGRGRPKLEETAAGRSDKCLIVPTDVTSPASVKALFATIRKELGRLDLLFNNAGLNLPGVSIADMTFDQWTSIVDVNLNGAFLCAQGAFRLMKEQTPIGGRIINNGSVSAHAPRPDSSAYTATKHAITGLTKSIALDGRRFDIACGQIDIGNADTTMTGRMKTGIVQADGSMREEPTMDVRHVADAVVHMAALPLEANVLFMTVMATKMPLAGRG
ncbi:putative oxidoreductase [Caulifigura coniformis]|uniref:Putative oxidoreductase n=1 Tax=Caulifigura coniformis TaxID=2527983 RepID=A0A517SMS2_9PLAN|nr:SDR family oxidoreductase [Caulifigura coniformis]QDT57420.1 putative oxidoreductase [Caulifigura coniformis]